MLESKYTLDILLPIVNNVKSIPEVLKDLDLKVTGANRARIRRYITKFQINTDHFKRHAWNKGKSSGRHHISFSRSRKLREYLISLGREYLCVKCQLLPFWCGKPLTLHIDHIDGDRENNSLENLRFLCPNCHQQTDTWGKGKIYG